MNITHDAAFYAAKHAQRLRRYTTLCAMDAANALLKRDFFELIFITAADERQKEHYEEEIKFLLALKRFVQFFIFLFFFSFFFYFVEFLRLIIK